MSTHYPLELKLTEAERDFASRWASVVLVSALVLLAAVLFFAVALPEGRADDGGWKRYVETKCESPYCISPMQLITAQRAGWMKHEKGNQVLVLDIHSYGEASSARVPIDAHVPFMERVEGSPEMTFRIGFADEVDNVLRASRLGHAQPVLVISPSMERSVLAALLLQEHGYSQVLIVNS